MAADVEASQVTLKLTTKLPARLRVPPSALAVPARLTRYGLSEVVNSMLALGACGTLDCGRCLRRGTRARLGSAGLSQRICGCASGGCSRADKPVAFDFLINDELLVTSLEAFMLQRSLSTARRARPRACTRPAAAAAQT